MLYSFGILPPAQLAVSFNAVRARLDPVHGSRTVPHITIKQPFELPAWQPEEQLVQTVSNICAGARPFVVEIEKVDVFHTQTLGSVVHLTVELSAPLRELHRQLVLGATGLGITHDFDPVREQQVFYPHLTLAQGLTPEGASAALGELHGAWPCSFYTHEIVIGRRDEDGTWRRPYVLRLGQNGERKEASGATQARGAEPGS